MQKRAESKKKKQTSQEKLEQLDRQEAALKEKLEVLNKNKSEAFTKFREVSERHSIFLCVYLLRFISPPPPCSTTRKTDAARTAGG